MCRQNRRVSAIVQFLYKLNFTSIPLQDNVRGCICYFVLKLLLLHSNFAIQNIYEIVWNRRRSSMKFLFALISQFISHKPHVATQLWSMAIAWKLEMNRAEHHAMTDIVKNKNADHQLFARFLMLRSFLLHSFFVFIFRRRIY